MNQKYDKHNNHSTLTTHQLQLPHSQLPPDMCSHPAHFPRAPSILEPVPSPLVATIPSILTWNPMEPHQAKKLLPSTSTKTTTTTPAPRNLRPSSPTTTKTWITTLFPFDNFDFPFDCFESPIDFYQHFSTCLESK